MNRNLAYSLQRADDLKRELMAEYEASLDSKTVPTKAEHLTHEICAQLRGILDRTARLYWDRNISPSLQQADRDAAVIYFPVTPDQNGFDSSLGRWRWKSVRQNHQALYDYLLGLQPFTANSNHWLKSLTDLANAGKHIDLVPQKRIEERITTVTGPEGGSISFGSNVIFGSGCRIMGAPVDPATQRILPTPGFTEKVEIWHAFFIEVYGVNAAAFIQKACADARRIVEDMTNKFILS